MCNDSAELRLSKSMPDEEEGGAELPEPELDPSLDLEAISGSD